MNQTKTNFVHIEESEFEIVINANNINYVQRMGNSVFIHFAGEKDPLHLRMDAGQSVWQLVRSSALTIHQANKKAETPDTDGFSQNP
jgi:hypothetical protein